MRPRNFFFAACATLTLLTALYAYQKPFKQYPAIEYYDFPLPPDWQEKTEWAFGRLALSPFQINVLTTMLVASIGEFLLTMWTRFVLNRRTISVE